MAKFKIKKSKQIYKSKIIRLCDDIVELNDGRRLSREILHHPGAVAIVPVIKKDKVILIKQFRYAAGDFLWELPAGTLEKNETPYQCAKRELEEETGYRTEKIEKMIQFYPTPGVSTEIIYIYKASNLTKTKQSLEDDEFLKIKVFSLKSAIDMIKNGKIIDGKTIIGLMSLKT